MKRVLYSLITVVGITFTAAGAGDVLQQLGYSADTAQKDVVFSLAVGQLGLDGNAKRIFKASNPAVRTAMVEQGFAWAKSYVNTPAFEAAYQEFRDGYKPQPPNAEGLSSAEMADAKRYYEEEVAQWKANYPATGKLALQTRLREFMRASANVDYNAQLVRRDGKMRFVDDEYESNRSSEWKLFYRAGREPVVKARILAWNWLKEMEKK